MRRFYALALLAAALPVLGSCERQPRLVILHTNDTHSHFEPIRSGADAGKGGAIERAAFIDSVRNAVGEDKVLLLRVQRGQKFVVLSRVYGLKKEAV